MSSRRCLEKTGQRARPGSRTGESGIRDHGVDGLDAGDWLFGESEAEGNSAQQFPIDIHRAAAHALQNSGFGKRTATEAGDDDGLFGAEILEYAEDLDLELFNSVPLKNSPADSMQSGVDVLEWEKLLSLCEADEDQQWQEPESELQQGYPLAVAVK